MKHDDLTYTIIGFAYKVSQCFGSRFSRECLLERSENRAGKSGSCSHAAGEAKGLV
jgi:hypothetical protein